MSECWIETVTGKRFLLLEPDPALVDIEDIAHALSCQCRWTGHAKWPISVAEHSWHVSYLCDPQDALWGLLHDATEAYMSDISRPLKHQSEMGRYYLDLERKLMAAICKRFDLPLEMPASVKRADNTMLQTERRHLMSGLSWDTDSIEEWKAEGVIAPIKLECWPHFLAKRKFLDRFEELTK